MNNTSLVRLGALITQRQDPHSLTGDEWPLMVDLALQHGLGPMLLHDLKQSALSMHDNPALRPLIEAAHHTAMSYVLLEKTQYAVNDALRSAHIPALWLKGAVLARTVYPEPTLRPMSDLDVLVPYAQREQALEVVRHLGYDFYTMNSLKPRSSGDEMLQRLSHHYHLKGGIANNVILELHFRLLAHNDELLSLEGLQWFWGQKQNLRLGGGSEFDGLRPEAHLLYLCAHAMLQHGEANLHLLRLFDLHQIITQRDLNWALVVEQAVIFGWTYAVERALRLSMVFFATPVPDEVLAQLVKERPVDEDISRVKRYAGAGNRWERVCAKLGDLSLREKAAYIFLIICPAPAYMRQRYHIKPGWPTWPYYFYRWFDQGRDAAWSMWKHLTGQYR